MTEPATAACPRAATHEAMSMQCRECGYQPGPTTATGCTCKWSPVVGRLLCPACIALHITTERGPTAPAHNDAGSLS